MKKFKLTVQNLIFIQILFIFLHYNTNAESIFSFNNLSYNINNTLQIENHQNNHNFKDDDDDYIFIKDLLDLSLSNGPFYLSARINGYQFIGIDYNHPYSSFSKLGKVYSSYTGRWFDITIGDFYIDMGKGSGLSLRKFEEFGLDNSLLGGKLNLNYNGIKLTTLYGEVNPAPMDSIFNKAVVTVKDRIGAAELTVPVKKYATIHGYNVSYDFKDHEHATQKSTIKNALISGGIVKYIAFAPYFDGWAQASFLQRRETGGNINGHAYHAGFNSKIGNLLVLLEVKDFDKYDLRRPLSYYNGNTTNSTFLSNNPYIFPSTLERDDMKVLDNTTVKGFRLKLDYSFMGTKTFPFFNYALFRNTYLKDNKIIYHAYAGIEQLLSKGNSLEVSGGYREVWNKVENKPYKKTWHLESDISYKPYKHYKVDLKTKHYSFKDYSDVGSTEAAEFIEGDMVMSLHITNSIILSGVFGYNTQDNRDGARHYFQSGGAAFRIGDYTDLKLTGGTIRGGIICMFGECKELPPFSGAKAELIISY